MKTVVLSKSENIVNVVTFEGEPDQVSACVNDYTAKNNLTIVGCDDKPKYVKLYAEVR